MRSSMRHAISLLLLMTVITGVLYPLAATGLAQLLFPHQANGSLLERDGRLAGSSLIGQSFSDQKYFWGRPSATAPQAYNGASSGGSNLGPTNSALTDVVKQRMAALQTLDPGQHELVPVDLVTASGSGLDPDISPAGAYYQASRIARERGLALDQVKALIAHNTEGRQWGLFGEPRVNVLALNIQLDQLH